MPRTRINPRRIKIHYSYAVEEIARALDVHKNTVRGWIKAGLPTIDDSRPALVLGRDLRTYLETRRQVGRSRCLPGTIYCLKCRAPRRPALGMVDFIPYTPTSGNLRALCEACGTTMHRRTRTAAIPAVMPDLTVKIVLAESRIGERRSASVHCDFSAGAQTHDNA